MGIITKRNGKILMILGILLIITGSIGTGILGAMFGDFLSMPPIYMSLDAIFILSIIPIGPTLAVIGILIFIVSSRRIPSKLMDILKTSVDTRTKISFLAQQLGINEKDVISTIFKLRSKGEPILISHSTSEVIYSPTLPPPTAPPLPMRAGVEMEAKPLEKPVPTPVPPPSPTPLAERVAMGKCPKCGEEVGEDERFCHSCGAKLVGAPPAAIPCALNVERMEKTKDVKGLIKALKHKDEDVRYGAALALISIGEPAVPPLIQALKDEDKNVMAGVALSSIGEPAVPPLIQALKDENSNVRGTVVWALGRIGDARAVPPLIHALKDESEYVRMMAAVALQTIKAKKSQDSYALFQETPETPIERKPELKEVKEILEKALESLKKPIFTASKAGDVERVKALLKEDPGLVNACAPTLGITPLYQAACEGHVEVVRVLLAHGANVNVPGWEGPLHIAACEGHVEVVRVLLAHGANVDARDRKGSTALQFAASKGQVEVVELLLAEGAEANARDNEGYNALQYAEHKGRGRFVAMGRKHPDKGVLARARVVELLRSHKEAR